MHALYMTAKISNDEINKREISAPLKKHLLRLSFIYCASTVEKYGDGLLIGGYLNAD